EAVIEAARPALSAYGSVIAHVGPLGSGQLMKSLNNYFYAAHLATASKMVELVRALQLDLDAAAHVLPSCSGSSGAFAIQAAHRFHRPPHDKGSERAMDILSEVVDSLRKAARDAGVDLTLMDRLVDHGIAVERLTRDAA